MKLTTAGLVLAVLTTVAHGAAVVSTFSQTNDTNTLPHTFVPSATDLINGLVPSAETGIFTQEGTGGTTVLTDGSFPSPITRDEGGAFQFSSFATGGDGGGTSVTFTLASPVTVTGIDVYGGWQDGGRDQQKFSIFYAVSADPLVFLPLTTVDFNPADPTGNPQVTLVSITDSTGTLATDVTALRFDFGVTENGYSGYSEIDVIPEPSAVGLLGLASAGILARRRRQS